MQMDCALMRGLQGEICLEPDPERAARELEARDLKFDYPDDTDHPVFARAPADPAVEFAASLDFATDPAVTSRTTGKGSDRWLVELSYLGDPLGPAG